MSPVTDSRREVIARALAEHAYIAETDYCTCGYDGLHWENHVADAVLVALGEEQQVGWAHQMEAGDWSLQVLHEKDNGCSFWSENHDVPVFVKRSAS